MNADPTISLGFAMERYIGVSDHTAVVLFIALEVAGTDLRGPCPAPLLAEHPLDAPPRWRLVDRCLFDSDPHHATLSSAAPSAVRRLTPFWAMFSSALHDVT